MLMSSLDSLFYLDSQQDPVFSTSVSQHSPEKQSQWDMFLLQSKVFNKLFPKSCCLSLSLCIFLHLSNLSLIIGNQNSQHCFCEIQISIWKLSIKTKVFELLIFIMLCDKIYKYKYIIVAVHLFTLLYLAFFYCWVIFWLQIFIYLKCLNHPNINFCISFL